MLIAVTGALAGCFHVLSGPDHLAAVAPLALEDRTDGWRVGWTWGVGHASGAVLVAVLAILLRDWLPSIEAISAWSERLVGAALIALGVWALRRSLRLRRALHMHGTVAHEHLHVQAGPAWMRRLGHGHASFCMGVLHGLAGSSHFLGVLPALALPTRGAALLYIAAFGVGTVMAMTAFAGLLGSAGARTNARWLTHRAMLTTTAVLAILVGAVWLVAPPTS
jgi:threonine/homoserine/homoserine lactone efflux protein